MLRFFQAQICPILKAAISPAVAKKANSMPLALTSNTESIFEGYNLLRKMEQGKASISPNVPI